MHRWPQVLGRREGIRYMRFRGPNRHPDCTTALWRPSMRKPHASANDVGSGDTPVSPSPRCSRSSPLRIQACAEQGGYRVNARSCTPSSDRGTERYDDRRGRPGSEPAASCITDITAKTGISRAPRVTPRRSTRATRVATIDATPGNPGTRLALASAHSRRPMVNPCPAVGAGTDPAGSH